MNQIFQSNNELLLFVYQFLIQELLNYNQITNYTPEYLLILVRLIMMLQ